MILLNPQGSMKNVTHTRVALAVLVAALIVVAAAWWGRSPASMVVSKKVTTATIPVSKGTAATADAEYETE